MKLILALVSLLFFNVAEAATLNWQDNSTNEQGFNVYRKQDTCAGAVAFVKLVNVNSNVKTFVDTTPTEGATYCYKVTSFNTAGESPSTNAVEFLVPFTVPSSPSNLTVSP